MLHARVRLPRPVVLLHAFPLNAAMWEPQAQALAAAGFTPVALDLPGFGQSPLQGETTLDDFARRVLERLDGLGVDRAAFVGLSMGGYVLFRLMAAAPQRAVGVVLANTRATPDSPEAQARRYSQASQVAAQGVEAIAEGFVSSALSPATRQDRREVVESVRRLVAAATPAGVVNALRAMAVRPDSTPLLGSLGCPALVIGGEQDALTPPDEARRMAQAIPGARLELLPQAGHLSNLEAPEAFNRALLGFLEHLPWAA